MSQQDQPNTEEKYGRDQSPIEEQDQKKKVWKDIPEANGDAPPGGQDFGERIHDEPVDEKAEA